MELAKSSKEKKRKGVIRNYCFLLTPCSVHFCISFPLQSLPKDTSYTLNRIKLCNDNIQPAATGWVTLILLYHWISSRAIQILALRAIAQFYPVSTIAIVYCISHLTLFLLYLLAIVFMVQLFSVKIKERTLPEFCQCVLIK